MTLVESPPVDSEFGEDLTRMLEKAIPRGTAPSRAFTAPTRSTPRLNLCQDDVKNGLGRLVLTLVKLLHELLERQAVRRMDGGALSEPEIEALGMTLMKQAEEIERLRKAFGLEEEDLDIDLGPLGKLF